MAKTLCSLFLVVILGLSAWGIVHNIRFVVPQETISQAFWIPANAKIHSSKAVQPGTFKFIRTFEEFQAATRPDQQVYVVYHVFNVVPFEPPFVEYFKPNGDGTFDYAQTVIQGPPSRPRLDSFLVGWDTALNENTTFQYTLIKTYYMIVWCSVAVVIAGIILWGMWWPRRRSS